MPFSTAAGAAIVRGAYVPIAYQKLSASSALVTFSNIPQIYQDLVIVMNFTMTAANRSLIYFNNDSTALYSTTVLSGFVNTGSYGNAGYRYTGGSSVQSGGLNNGADTAIPSSQTCRVFNYANSTNFKNVLSHFANDKNGNGASENTIGLYRSTSPITAINLATGAGSWSANSTFSLYGIRTVNQ
jgi:hypothetical protein